MPETTEEKPKRPSRAASAARNLVAKNPKWPAFKEVRVVKTNVCKILTRGADGKDVEFELLPFQQTDIQRKTVGERIRKQMGRDAENMNRAPDKIIYA